jgi:hypothetical protein
LVLTPFQERIDAILCLIYNDEQKLAAMSKGESEAFIGEYMAFTVRSPERALRGRRGAAAGGDGDDGADPQRPVSTTDGPFAETRSSSAASTSSRPAT